MCLWREERAFDGPHIEEAMVISVLMGGRTDYTVWEERRGYFMVGKSREAVIVGGGDEPGKLWIEK